MFPPSRPLRRSVAGLAVAGALLGTACTGDGESETTSIDVVESDPAETADNESSEAEDADPADAEPPVTDDVPAASSGLEGAIGEASDLVLGWFNGQPLDEGTYDVAFDDGFRRVVAFDQMTPLLDQLRLDRPFEVQQIERSTTTEADLIIVGASGERARLSIAVVSAEDPTMTGLFIGPAAERSFETPTSLAAAVDRLQALGVTRLGAYTDDCMPLEGGPDVAADDQAPIGSGFKLWVLAAVVQRIDDGTLSWTDEVEIRDELDSIPSGITQNDEPGSTLTVRTLAERMIEISDNTATDHLMALVGRQAIEDILQSTGHTAPERNRPFLTTREFTIVKFSDSELRSQYLAADETERRRILAEDVPELELPPLSNITTVADPLDVETLEWFASPADSCRVLTTLAADTEAAAILSLNPGMPDRSGRWSSILYKGGSEPGVFAMAWLVTDPDGERRVIAGSVANEAAVIDEFEAANLLAYVRDTID